MFNDGSSSSSLNSTRSAINFFTMNHLNLDQNKFVKRLFKFFYQQRPLRPKYSSFWPVDKLLNHLRTWDSPDKLSLKDLTLKTIALMALSSSDRGQTLHLIKTDSMKMFDDRVEFVVSDRTKSTRKFLKPILITCVTTEDPALDVALHVSHYVERTKDLRSTSSKQLFISYVTKKAVSRQTLSRWLRSVLDRAGIDISVYGAHSYRGAGLAKAKSKGASIPQIVAGGNWKNVTTFLRHYDAPSESLIENLILE